MARRRGSPTTSIDRSCNNSFELAYGSPCDVRDLRAADADATRDVGFLDRRIVGATTAVTTVDSATLPSSSSPLLVSYSYVSPSSSHTPSWRSLPNEITESESVNILKRRLASRTHLVSSIRLRLLALLFVT